MRMYIYLPMHLSMYLHCIYYGTYSIGYPKTTKMLLLKAIPELIIKDNKKTFLRKSLSAFIIILHALRL